MHAVSPWELAVPDSHVLILDELGTVGMLRVVFLNEINIECADAEDRYSNEDGSLHPQRECLLNLLDIVAPGGRKPPHGRGADGLHVSFTELTCSSLNH